MEEKGDDLPPLNAENSIPNDHKTATEKRENMMDEKRAENGDAHMAPDNDSRQLKVENEAFIEERKPLRSQYLSFSSEMKSKKPFAKDVIVLAFGSHGIRYGFAVDSTPKRVFPAVAFPRSDKARKDPDSKPFRIPQLVERTPEEQEEAKKTFENIRSTIAEELALGDRRRGGGRPTPWKIEIETVASANKMHPSSTQAHNRVENEFELKPPGTLIGKDVELLSHDQEKAKLYDIIYPIWDGKLLFDCGAPPTLVRKALDLLLQHIVQQLSHDRRHRNPAKAEDTPAAAEGDVENTSLFDNDGTAKNFVTLVVPEASQRRDVGEIVDAVFRIAEMQTAAVFVHQSAVSCALGAGLATCAVVDIGHSATTVACVEDGIVCGESRIHLDYGSSHIQNTFDLLLNESPKFRDMLKKSPGSDGNTISPVLVAYDKAVTVPKASEQLCGFNVDENDTLAVTVVKAPSGRSFRVKLGVGIRALPCYGLINPVLLKSASEVMTAKKNIPQRGVYERNSEDDNFVSDIFLDLRRSGIATAALPIGTFSNDRGQPAASTVHAENASIVDAIIWSIARAVEMKRPDPQSRTAEHYRRYLNAIVLAGGGASIDGIALALEARIKKGFIDAGLNIADVTVIDGGKGKGDEELAAAAALLKDAGSDSGIVDDTDTASLPWKGGAVMVEADAVNDYWVYKDDWDLRNVRGLREKIPFYW